MFKFMPGFFWLVIWLNTLSSIYNFQKNSFKNHGKQIAQMDLFLKVTQMGMLLDIKIIIAAAYNLQLYLLI